MSQGQFGKVAVLGARGGVGKETVLRLLERNAEEVQEVRAIIRDPSKIAQDFFPSDSRLKIMAGDVTKEESLDEVLQGCTFAIFTACGGRASNAEVDDIGLKKTIVAAEKHGLKRVAVCSSQLVDPVNRWSPIRIMLNSIVWGVMDSKHRGELQIRQFCTSSSVEYVIVRPGRLANGSLGGSGGLRVGQTNGDFCSGSMTTRADTALVLVNSLLNSQTRNATFELAGGGPTASISDLFTGLVSDNERAKK